MLPNHLMDNYLYGEYDVVVVFYLLYLTIKQDFKAHHRVI
jgi:hypothetical protein